MTVADEQQDVADADILLLCRVAAGDEAAFGQLYHRHVHACRHRARFVLAAPEFVDDVLQTVFLDVWTHAARFDGQRGSVRGWLLRLTHFKAVDLVRAQERHVSRHARERLLADQPEQASPHDLLESTQDVQRLVRAVGRLPRLQREVLALCFFGELSQRDAADVLGVPVGTVKSRTHSGVLRLRLLLGDDPAVPQAVQGTALAAAQAAAR
jgi:RNA polymerase sigma-70 factor (ECF subfamily)